MNNFKDSHRPLGMSECLKKIFEAFFEPAVPDLFKTEPDQYGFKKHHSCADAACDLDEKMNFLKEKGLLKEYTLKKLDNKSAFDRVCHKAIKSFLNLHIHNPHYKVILLQLFLVQSVYISIGSFKSMIMYLTRGIIQGTKLSPKMFIAILNHAIHYKQEQLPGFIYIFADDILMLCKKKEIDKATLLLADRLSTVGLILSNEPGKCKIIESGDKWLGLKISPHGLSIESQVQYNIQKCMAALSNLRSVGIFRGKLKKELLLSVFRSRIIPVLEYGLNWHAPVEKYIDKIDKFIRKEIRYLGSSPQYIPNEDLMVYYEFESFSYRWADLHARFINSRAFKQNNIANIQNQPKSKWSFRVNSTLKRLEDQDHSNVFTNMFLRVHDTNLKEVKCNSKNHDSTSNTHSKVNQFYQCLLKPITQFNHTPNASPKDLQSYKLPSREIQTFITKTRTLDTTSVLIYTDASYKAETSSSNGAFLAIDEYGFIEEKGIKLDKLGITSSSRGEVAAIVEAINNYPYSDVVIYTDSEVAIQQSNLLYLNDYNWNKIGNMDLWTQIINVNVNFRYLPLRLSRVV